MKWDHFNMMDWYVKRPVHLGKVVWERRTRFARIALSRSKIMGLDDDRLYACPVKYVFELWLAPYCEPDAEAILATEKWCDYGKHPDNLQRALMISLRTLLSKGDRVFYSRRAEYNAKRHAAADPLWSEQVLDLTTLRTHRLLRRITPLWEGEDDAFGV